MANYAIAENDNIINVIVADSKEIAEELTGLSVIETDGKPWIGWKLYNDKWRPPMPSGDCEWDEELEQWISLNTENNQILLNPPIND